MYAKISECKLTLLHLNEQIWYDILPYLNDAEIYYVLRSVCSKVRYLANKYIQLVSIFLYHNKPHRHPRNAYRPLMTRILHVFKRKHHFSCFWRPFAVRCVSVRGARVERYYILHPSCFRFDLVDLQQ